jgi:hypothetical protein
MLARSVKLRDATMLTRLSLLVLFLILPHFALAAECVTVRGAAPAQNVDGSALPLDQILTCAVKKNAAFVGPVKPASRMAFCYPIAPGQCVPVSDRFTMTCTDIHGESAPSLPASVDKPACNPVTPPKPPAVFGPPQNFRVTITSGTTGTIHCDLAPDTRRVILFAVNADGSLGSRQQVYATCGATFTKFGKGRRFVLKAENRITGKQSARSNVVTIP